MKKFLQTSLLVIGSVAAGLLVWRKVEAQRTEDLWAEAEKISADMDAAAGKN